MLQTIKSYIKETANTSFAEYYQNYLMTIQDLNIQLELKYLQVQNLLDVNSVDLITDSAYKELICDDKFK